MAFHSKRGRPKAPPAPEKDLGTPELQAKRKHHITAEPIDICLEQGIITRQQHQCGLHLRWLYTLRYGAPGISCRPVLLEEGHTPRPDDPKWRAEREAEYKEAVQQLRHWRCYEAVMSVCIYQQTPCFISDSLRNQARTSPHLFAMVEKKAAIFSDGLSILEALWKKKEKS